MFPLPTVFPPLSHRIVGTGLPMALQWNVTVEASRIVWSVGLVIQLGGSMKTDSKRHEIISFVAWM